jgi:hypothetical protein
VKRLTAEEFVDALAAVTQTSNLKPAFDPTGGAALPHKKAKWIWSTAGAERSAAPGTVYFRKDIDLDSVTSGQAVVTADNRFVLYVNGRRVASGEEWAKPVSIDLAPFLKSNAKNVLAIEAENTTSTPNPAGLFVSGRIVHRKTTNNPPVNLASDKTWVWTDRPAAGWERVDFDAASWRPAVELGNEKMGPWKLDEKLASSVMVASGGPARAALCPADPLTTALGRTNREQVTTDRAAVATTLQALELSNGGTLAEALRQGAAKMAADKSQTPAQLVERIYLRTLSRRPTAGEMQAAVELVGTPVRAEGVEDLLWIVAMLPEFQLIR